MELFEVISAMIERPSEWAKLKPYEKAKHFFMINRFCAIAHPNTAHAFNHLRVDQASALDFWHRTLSKTYNRVPKWMYTKTKKEKAVSKKIKVSPEAVRYYLDRHQLSLRDLRDAINIFGEDAAMEPIRKIEKLMKDSAD
jgi:hypothetical protein